MQYQLSKSHFINVNININIAIIAYQYFLINALCTSGVRIVSNRMQSVRSELCEHRFCVSCLIQL